MTSEIGDSTANLTDMPTGERNSETSQLVSSGNAAKPSVINMINNISALLFIGVIIYCCFNEGVTLFSFHPVLMSLGWLLIMASAVNAITPGDVATEWMPIRLRSARHWVLQLLSVTIIMIGFIVILSNKFINNKDHFVTLHAKFGLAAIICMVVTSLGGLGALYSLKLKNYLAPIYTKVIHASAGLLTFGLGVIAIILGNFSKWWHFGEVLRYISLVLVLVTMVLTILRPILKVYFRLKERLGYTN